jgi:SAM-dependent methyltransferase
MIFDPLHRFLRSPLLYVGLQRILGADRLRRICLDEFLRLREGERVLDIGCGPGYILNYMPRVDYVGFDTEPRYIEYAKEHFPDRGQFFCEHFAQEHVAKLEPFDAIMLFGVIHHLDDVVAENLLGLLAKCLVPNGRIVTLDPCLAPGQSRIARFVAEADRGRFVREEPAYRRLGAEEFVEVEANLVSNVCRIPSTELIMRLGNPRRQKLN